jgi:hypothetical protein
MEIERCYTERSRSLAPESTPIPPGLSPKPASCRYSKILLDKAKSQFSAVCREKFIFEIIVAGIPRVDGHVSDVDWENYSTFLGLRFLPLF